MDDIGGLMLEGMTAGDDEAFFKRSMDRFAREAAQTRTFRSMARFRTPEMISLFPLPWRAQPVSDGIAFRGRI